jgi:YD repeat-containing protein
MGVYAGRGIIVLAGITSAWGASAPAAASEVVTYTYDSRGRLTQAAYAGGTDAYNSAYTYDNADNRATAVVTGSANGNQDYIVVPGGGEESEMTGESGVLLIEPAGEAN